MHTLALLVTSLATQPARPIDFDTQVVPVLTRAGCNAGSCHGAAVGRGGFRLSLWGSNPAADYETLVRELEGRRVNLAQPRESLVLLKPTGQLHHGGGSRLAPNGPGARLLLDWLRSGATRARSRRLLQFDVNPAQTVLAATGKTVDLQATARFDDGTTEDVTPWAVFSATDPAAVELAGSGKATVLRPGQHTVLVRYLDRMVAIRLTVPLGKEPVDLARQPRHNFIDDEILATLSTLRLEPAPTCDDHTLLRRVTLDLTGTLPTPQEVRAFTEDHRQDKRARVIDRLLASRNFVDYWSLQWGKLLGISSRRLGKEGTRVFHEWIRDQVARGTPLDRMAREMLTALGDSRRVGPVNFSRVPTDARTQAEYISRVFMGVRLQCANCHNHPLDRWTQDDYHGLAAVFARVERGAVVRLVSHGEVIHPRTGEAALPRLPGVRFLEEGKDSREELAEWMTSPDNPYFARAAVNRLWKEMMGRGLVEPVDDLRSTNPATHDRLLGRLARDLVEHRYDVRHTLRLIASSAAYQRSGITTAANRSDDRFYSRALVKALPAEVRADTIALVTGVPDRFAGQPVGTRAVTLFDPAIPAPALDILGRCSRTGPCEEETAGGGLARTLHLINGGLLNDRIGSDQGRLRKWLAAGRTNTEIMEDFYLLAFSRPPRKQERDFWASKLRIERAGDRRATLEDFLWGLLTSREFTTNH
jgi:Protein of unknown function (DUF1549)/Protein of unknown function (DUF1553)